MNDAEDDLKDWRLELDDLPSLDNTSIPILPTQHQKGGDGSDIGGDSGAGHHTSGVQGTESMADGSRISSGTSTGAADQHYASSGAPISVPA